MNPRISALLERSRLLEAEIEQEIKHARRELQGLREALARLDLAGGA